MGIQASLTGHLVIQYPTYETMRPGAITRMVDMGVPNYLVAGSVIGVFGTKIGTCHLLEV